jgi:hypothetical protein
VFIFFKASRLAVGTTNSHFSWYRGSFFRNKAVGDIKLTTQLHLGLADQLARQDSSRPFIGPEPALSISAKIAREVIRGWTNKKYKEYWQSIQGQRQAREFLKRPSARRAGELLNLNRNQLRILTGHSFKGTLV